MFSDPRNPRVFFQADDLTWGKNLGCDFARLSCNDLIEATEKGQASYPFCSDFMSGSSRTFCTSDKKSVGSCNMVKFSRRIPKIYRNFNEVDGVKSSDLNYVSLSERVGTRLREFHLLTPSGRSGRVHAT